MMNGFVLNAVVLISKINVELEDYRELQMKMWSSPKSCAVTALIINKGTSGTLVFPFIFHMKPFLNMFCI